LFNDDLKDLLYDTFWLASNFNIPPAYTDSLSPGDRAMYVMFGKDKIKQKAEQAGQELPVGG
jgi:hypothetical protein